MKKPEGYKKSKSQEIDEAIRTIMQTVEKIKGENPIPQNTPFPQLEYQFNKIHTSLNIIHAQLHELSGKFVAFAVNHMPITDE
jgi:nitrogenase molybdenum-iron protein alpha/beta subunit